MGKLLLLCQGSGGKLHKFNCDISHYEIKIILQNSNLKKPDYYNVNVKISSAFIEISPEFKSFHFQPVLVNVRLY